MGVSMFLKIGGDYKIESRKIYKTQNKGSLSQGDKIPNEQSLTVNAFVRTEEVDELI